MRSSRRWRCASAGFSARRLRAIVIDDGALSAVLERGSSLLPKGIREVSGNFSRGEVIRIRSLWAAISPTACHVITAMRCA